MAYPFQFTKAEIVDIVVSVVAIALALTLSQGGGIDGIMKVPAADFVSLFTLFLFTIGIGFVLHEIMHKYYAIKFGAWAQFQAWTLGLALMFGMALFLPILFIAPGAVVIYANSVSRRENGVISVVGPLTNIAISVLFLVIGIAGMAFVGGDFGTLTIFSQKVSVFFVGAGVNAFLAFFNMLPVPPLDGSKVIVWDFRIWLGVTLISFVLMTITGMGFDLVSLVIVLVFALLYRNMMRFG
ncbi:MAG: site-2 protease family protein [Candidatus Micrarchaeia archaeon]